MRGELELGDVLLDIGVGVAKGAQEQAPADGEWGLLRLGALRSQVFDSAQAKRMQAWNPAYEKLEVRELDVLMVRVNGAPALVGATCVARGVRPRLVLSDLMYRLVPDERRVSPDFLGLALSAEDVRRQIRTAMRGTSGQFQLPQAEVRSLRIPDVPLSQQRRIVAVHAAFERRIGALERELGKLDHLRRGLRDSGVSGPLTQLGEVLTEKPKNGYSPSEVHEWTGLLALGLGCLTSEGFVPKQLKRVPDSPMARRFRLVDGDLLMSRANTRELVGLVGRYQDVGQSCIYPDLMMRLRPDEQRCLSAYLEMALAASPARAAVQAEARGTSESMVKISASVVEALRIPLPSLERQREVVEAAGLFDNRIAKQQAVVAELRTVQRGVCEDLLRG
ncbi:hypothetical protein [Streptomyces sp. Wh19]|uniref:hypothetical protein n=1 Tax=Streptomyces sp. Wh19 TaxID=3076629 RepID=UPI002958C6B3|nr:hypothetical protein [Streptomyces sp. Wh19]MDV9196101.1 hypothetical protein [Streptomyces sp. Wh19]